MISCHFDVRKVGRYQRGNQKSLSKKERKHNDQKKNDKGTNKAPHRKQKIEQQEAH